MARTEPLSAPLPPPSLCLLFSVEHDKSNYTFKLRYTILSPSFFSPSRHRFYALHFFPLLLPPPPRVFPPSLSGFPNFSSTLLTFPFHTLGPIRPTNVDVRFVPPSPPFLFCRRFLFSRRLAYSTSRSFSLPLPTFVSTDVSCAYRVDLSVSFLHSFVSRDS